MKLELNENTLNTYIRRAIMEEIEEDTWYKPWTWGRDKKNDRWGYQWNNNLTGEQNRERRNANKEIITNAGYRNYDEYTAGKHGNEKETQPQQKGTGFPSNLALNQRAPFAEDGNYDKNRVAKFQTWFNLPANEGGMGGHLVVDGIWGKFTQAAWNQWLSKEYPGIENNGQ